MVRLIDRPNMTIDVYHGRKTTMQQQHQFIFFFDLVNTVTKYVPPNHLVYLNKVFAIATTFQKSTFIVKYCPVTSTYGACNHFLKSN